MKLREIFNIEQIQDYLEHATVEFAGQVVWDYKEQDGELRLIHEPIKGSESFEAVTLGELKDFQDLNVVSETLQNPVNGYEFARVGKKYKLILSV